MKQKPFWYNQILMLIPLSVCSYHTIIPQPAKPAAEQKQNPYLQTIHQSFKKLPEQLQPINTKQALISILQGASVWKAVTQGLFYNALHIKNLTPQTAEILNAAFNLPPDHFWLRIHNDANVQHEIERANVQFTRENCISPEHKMLFKITYVRTHITEPEIIEQIKKAYQEAVIDLQWYLYGQAIIQDGIFATGMLTIPDPTLDLFLFLDGYAELISPRYKLYGPVHPHSLWQSEAYTRKTHNWSSKPKFQNHSFGIDLKDHRHESMPVLPGQNSHILFGHLLSDNLTYIQWEPVGFTLNFSQSDFSAISQTFKSAPKKDSATSKFDRKEKVTQDVLYQFKSRFDSNLNKHQSDQIQKNGITAMRTLLSPKQEPLFTKYLVTEKKYPKETLHYRKGNEIILVPKKFVPLS